MVDSLLESLKVCVDVYPEDGFLENALRSAEPVRATLVDSKKWEPGQILRVRFLDGNPAIHRKVEAIAHQWSQFINIKFNFGNHAKSEIRISFRPGGSWSLIGTDALGRKQSEPTMNYGWLKTSSSDEEYSRVVLHEFGHALGCIHEHQHPEAGIPWDKNAVYRYYMGPPNNWSKEDVDRNLFSRYSKSITQFSKFDTKSIMLYPIPKALTTNGYEVRASSTLSETDKAFMRSIYPFSTGGGSGQIVIYHDADYRGAAQKLGVGKYGWGQLPNDTISSLKVPAGMKVTLYEHTEFKGKRKTFTRDTPYVGKDFNDLASSIVVENA